METGLYYLNARMYDPVTARFLQADTYAGSQSDPLSLNLYTYCMNNPERYIDPSGHIAIELAVIVISAVVAGMAVEAGIQKFIEKKVCIDYNRIVGEGLFSGAISAISFGTGNLLKCTIGPLAAKNALSTGTGLTAKTLAAALIANAAGGAASEAAEEMAHQFFVEGRTFSQIDYRQIGISAALGTVVSAGSTLAGAGIDQLKAKRAAKAAGGIAGNAEDMLPARMQLQYFAGEADGSNYRKSSGKYDNTADFLVNVENRNGKYYTDKNTIDKIGQIESKGENFSLLNKKILNSRVSTEGGTSIVYRYGDKYGTKYLIHEVTDQKGYIIHRDFDTIRILSGQLINKKH